MCNRMTLELLVLSQLGDDCSTLYFLAAAHFPPLVLSRFQDLTQKMDQFGGA
jgi:hypothetical protein